MFPVSKVHLGHLIHGPNRVSATIVSRFSAPGAFRDAGSTISRRLRPPRQDLMPRPGQTSARPPPAWPPSRKGCRAGQALPAVPRACTRVALQGLPVQGVGVGAAATAPFDPAPRRHGGCSCLPVTKTAEPFQDPLEPDHQGPVRDRRRQSEQDLPVAGNSPGCRHGAGGGPAAAGCHRQGHPRSGLDREVRPDMDPAEDWASVRSREAGVLSGKRRTRGPGRRCRSPRRRVRPRTVRRPPSPGPHPAMTECTGWPAGSRRVPVRAEAAGQWSGDRSVPEPAVPGVPAGSGVGPGVGGSGVGGSGARGRHPEPGHPGWGQEGAPGQWRPAWPSSRHRAPGRIGPGPAVAGRIAPPSRTRPGSPRGPPAAAPGWSPGAPGTAPTLLPR